MSFIIGVDPGASGALALLTDGGDLLEVADMPIVTVDGRKRVSSLLLTLQIKRWGPQIAVIEKVGVMPRDGKVGAFSFGYGAGVVEGVCVALGIAPVFVLPAAWKKAMRVTADKATSRLMAQRLWPAHAGLFVRVKDADRAEAALIGFHGRAQWQRSAA